MDDPQLALKTAELERRINGLETACSIMGFLWIVLLVFLYLFIAKVINLPVSQ